MNIWILNHYAVPQKYYYLARSYNFAQQLIKRGHSVTIFAASSVHNSDINLIEGKEQYREMEENGIPYVLLRGRQYEGSGKARVINHVEGAWRMYRHCPKFIGKYGKPDVIYASAGQSLTLVAGIFLAKKLGIPCVSEVTDLWPESFVAYGLVSPTNPVLKLLYAGERWIYKKSDAIIFSMEGGRDYIIEKGWDKAHGGPIDMSKIYHINNGVDLDSFDFNKENHKLDDPELENDDCFKAVYCGSIRKVNNVRLLVDTAEKLKELGADNIKLLIYGDGDEMEQLKHAAEKRSLNNIVFKGRVGKKYIPYILSHSDLCLMHWNPTPISMFGMSMNKFFEYLAGGRPILSNNEPAYDLVVKYNCGVSEMLTDADCYAARIKAFADMPELEYKTLCNNSRNAASIYDFKKLTDQLLHILGSATKSHR